MSEEVKSVRAGKYELVARQVKQVPHAIIWSQGKVVSSIPAASIEDAWRLVCTQLVDLLMEDARAHGELPYTASDATNAFLRIAPRLSNGQKAMLRAHMNAPERKLTATQLASAASYASYSAANLQYGLLGAMLFAEMPELNIPTRGDGSRIMTCAIASSQDFRDTVDDQWVWQMRPHIAEGLRAAAIV